MATKQAGYFCFLFVIIFILTGHAFAAICPQGDLNDDCKVDLLDLDIFVAQWLNPELCDEDEICADFVAPEGVDFADFSVFANSWLAQIYPLVINEFMASNNSDSNIHDPYGDFDDWIEIHNSSDTPIDLAGMYLTDDLANPTKWQVPAGYSSQTTVPAGGFIVFWADDETAEARFTPISNYRAAAKK